MQETLAERIYNAGLIAGIPAASEDRTLNAIKALTAGEIHAIMFPWNKQLLPMLGKIRLTFPKLLVGVQGPWAQVKDALRLGGDFIASDLPEGEKSNKCFKREGNVLLDGDKEIAQCNNKLVFAADLHRGDWALITQRAHEGLTTPAKKRQIRQPLFLKKLFTFPKKIKVAPILPVLILRP